MATGRVRRAASSRAVMRASADDAEAEMRQAALRSPTQREPWIRLAVHCFDRGEMQSAISFAEAALAIPADPATIPSSLEASAELHGILYRALLSLGRRDEARPHFDKCRALDPAHPIHARYLDDFAAPSRAVEGAAPPGPSRRRASARPRVPSFSVVTVVRNESEGLPRLLESLAEFRARGGEVLVLDTGSDDDTVKLAKEAGCEVVSEPHRFDASLTASQVRRFHEKFAREGEGPFVSAGARIFDFAAARNRAASLARNPFQLAVDGRDVVDAMDIAALDRRVRAGDAQVLYFETRRLQRRAWVLEARDYFHDRRCVQWLGRAHNFTGPRDPARPPRKAMLSRDELRVTHHSDASKVRAYQLAGAALDVMSSPRSLHRRLILGHELAARGHLRSALALFLDLDRPEAPLPLRSAGLAAAAACRAHLEGRLDLDLLFRAARRDPGRRQPLLQLGRHFLAASNFQAAAAFATAALAIQARVGPTEMEDDLGAGPHAILYWALFWLGRHGEARFHHEMASRLDPTNPVYLEHARFFADLKPRGRTAERHKAD
ncbi:MAG: glycosyltransferase [Vicinamibacteria bacterium]|nr:glycosyltransferase [Vicinamibacteria bacterium]